MVKHPLLGFSCGNGVGGFSGCVERHRGDETFQTRYKKDQSNRSI